MVSGKKTNDEKSQIYKINKELDPERDEVLIALLCMSEDTQKFLCLFETKYPNDMKIALMTWIATKLHGKKLLSSHEFDDAKENIKKLNDGKSIFEIMENSDGISKILRRFGYRHAEVVFEDDGNITLETHSPYVVLIQTLSYYQDEIFIDAMTAIIEKMRMDGLLSIDEADDAMNDLYHSINLIITGETSKETHIFRKIVTLIDNDYVYITPMEEGIRFNFTDTGNGEEFKQRMRETGFGWQ